MEAGIFYLLALPMFFTFIAALADFIGWLYPEWDPGAQGEAYDSPELQIGERASESQ